MNNVLILGGGISGLSAAWYCRKRFRSAHITLLEKEGRLGGWVQTRQKAGFLFEEGPRTFPFLSSPHLLELIREVGLEGELIFSQPKKAKRYLWHQKKLCSLSSVLLCYLPSFLVGQFRKAPKGDPSIYEFVKYKFGVSIAERLFDPLTLGIYGGDIRRLSFSSCFPSFRLSRKGGPLFTLKRGMGRLIEEMQKQLDIEIISGARVDEIHPQGVVSQGKFWSADHIFSALPGPELGRLSELWPDFSTLSLWRVFLAYPHPVLPREGFGYLIATAEKEEVLGMVWDSSLFPEQNLERETRLTVMIRSTCQDPLQAAFLAAERHLGIHEKPIYTSCLWAEKAIPQFHVGYQERLDGFLLSLKQKYPRLIVLGNYLQGPSVEACIRQSREALR